jgi:hypothetical protein
MVAVLLGFCTAAYLLPHRVLDEAVLLERAFVLTKL